MVVYCSVPNCKSARPLQNDIISFHEYPVNEVLREQWLNAVNKLRKDQYWVPGDRDVVCSNHFLPSDFKRGLKLRLLIPGAIPTVFSGYPSQTQLTPARSRRRRKTRTIPSDDDETTFVTPDEDDVIVTADEQVTIPSPDEDNVIVTPDNHDTIASSDEDEHDIIVTPYEHENVSYPSKPGTITTPYKHEILAYSRKPETITASNKQITIVAPDEDKTDIKYETNVTDEPPAVIQNNPGFSNASVGTDVTFFHLDEKDRELNLVKLRCQYLTKQLTQVQCEMAKLKKKYNALREKKKMA